MIEPKPEYNIGTRAVTHRQAANAIFNKLNFALSVAHVNPTSGALVKVLSEALLLSDAIVKEPTPEEEKARKAMEAAEKDREGATK